LWSVFNEEPMQGTQAGYEMVRRMRQTVRALDTSRPVTGAMNDGLFTPINVSQALDVIGFNYQQGSYDTFHAANPDLPMTSSEDTSSYSIRGEYLTDEDKHIKGGLDDEPTPWGETHRDAWKQIATRDFIAGGFVWTGFDYRGEPTPYEWPTNASLMGIMDSCGFEKVPYYIHQAQWTKDRPVVNIAIHWNWHGKEGQAVRVMVCANTEEVSLALNGKQIARQLVDPFEMNFFDVPYEPGELLAVGYVGGREVLRSQVETTGVATALLLVPDRNAILADGVDAMPIMVKAVDAKGRVVPGASPLVAFTVHGGVNLGVGNGDPNSLEPDQADHRRLFHGLAQIIVRADAASGSLTITATSDGLKGGKLIIPASGAPLPRYQATSKPVELIENWFRAPIQSTAPDPLMKPGSGDNNSWQWFRAGVVLPPEAQSGFALCAVSVTPYAQIQRQGGHILFFAVKGKARWFIDGIEVGEKSSAVSEAVRVPIAPGTGERRLAVIFEVVPGESYGFADVVQIQA
jgi:beta-galactosidase